MLKKIKRDIRKEKKPDTVPIEEYERLKKTFSEALMEKDRVIEQLKEENAIVLRTALKQSGKTKDFSDKVERLLDKKHDLSKHMGKKSK